MDFYAGRFQVANCYGWSGCFAVAAYITVFTTGQLSFCQSGSSQHSASVSYYDFSPDGQIRARTSFESHWEYPPLINACSSKEFFESLECSSKQREFAREILGDLGAALRSPDFLKNGVEVSRRIAEDERKLSELLGPQVVLIAKQLHSRRDFYRTGLADSFAIAPNVGNEELKKRFEQDLKKLIEQSLKTLFEGTKVSRRDLSELVEFCTNDFLTPSISPFYEGVCELATLPYSDFRELSILPTFQITQLGTLRKVEGKRRDQFSEFLFAARATGLLEYADLKRQIASLAEFYVEMQSRRSKDIVAVAVSPQRQDVVHQIELRYEREMAKLISEIFGDLSAEQRRRFELCQLSSLILRCGPRAALYSEFSYKCLQPKLDQTAYRIMSKNALKCKHEIETTCARLERDYLEELFIKPDLILRQDLSWIYSKSVKSVAPLELLLQN